MRSASFLNRLKAHALYKLKLALILGVSLKLGYFGVQYAPLLPARRLELGIIDLWVDFDTAWTWAYMTLYPTVIFLPWLVESREALRRFAFGFLSLSAVAIAIFAVFPVACPRPAGDSDALWLYQVLVSIDDVRNAFPSLHCALALYTALFTGRALAPTLGASARAACTAASWIWVALILYSTLATKQHYFVDVLGGLVLGALGHWWAWRRPPLAWLRHAASPGRTIL